MVMVMVLGGSALPSFTAPTEDSGSNYEVRVLVYMCVCVCVCHIGLYRDLLKGGDEGMIICPRFCISIASLPT